MFGMREDKTIDEDSNLMQFTRYALADDHITILSESVIIAEDDSYLDVDTPLTESASSYAKDLRGITRALWNGSMDFDQTFAMFQDNVRIGLTRAWYEGAKECGIQPSELSPEELTALRDILYSEDTHIFGFLDYVELNSKESGGKFAPILSRVDLWANRYLDVVNRAKMMSCADRKMAWRLGPTEEHCVDCNRLNGKVKRASQWARYNIRPQSPQLSCHGFNCLCYFEPTDEPMSKGPLPRLSGG